MKLPRRQFLHLAAGAAAVPAVPRFAWAQAYPTRPIRIVVGLAAGSTPDITARLMAQSLSERLRQPIIIDNRPGAGTNIGLSPAQSMHRARGCAPWTTWSRPALDPDGRRLAACRSAYDTISPCFGIKLALLS